METTTLNYLQKARHFATAECYKDSFNFYQKAMEKNPHVKKLIEFEFRIVLMKLNEYLAVVENNRSEILTNFETAMRIFPGNVNLLCDIGKYLYQCSYFHEALVHFEKALQIDASLVSIEKNLNNAKKIIFSRAHFRLLNDKFRNRMYLDAIRTMVLPNAECVLDTDTGTGLSAMYANECSAMSTTACDASKSMVKLAERIMNDNNVRDILVINKPATNLHVDDVYGARTMLVTNKFDSGLFGDQLLQTLKHAWENLLAPYGRVIPGKAEYYVMGAKCDRIMLKYQVGSDAKELLKVPTSNIHTEPFNFETYYGEDLSLYDDIEYVTEQQMLLSINFNDYYDIDRHFKSSMLDTAQITAMKNCEVNVIVGWFKLYLTEDIIITNDPRLTNRSAAWQQAVFFDFIPKQLKENDSVPIQFQTHKGKLRFMPDTGKSITRLSPPTIAFLNDTEYINSIVNSVQTATIYLGQIAITSEIDMVDLCPFPLFGMLMMKRGARSLICYARHSCDKTFFEQVFTQNNIPLTKVKILLAEQWNHSVFKDQTYHVVFCNALDLSGDIDVRLSRVLQHLKYGHLATGGLCLPAKISLIGQLISSSWLDKHNRMSEDEKSTFRLASQVNLFQVSQTNCIDATRLKFSALSDATVLATCCRNMRSEVTSISVMSDGVCNGVLCWYEVQLLEGDEGISTKRSSCFVDCTAFLPNPKVKVFRGDVVSVIRCVDCDGSYKLVIDLELG